MGGGWWYEMILGTRFVDLVNSRKNLLDKSVLSQAERNKKGLSSSSSEGTESVELSIIVKKRDFPALIRS